MSLRTKPFVSWSALLLLLVCGCSITALYPFDDARKMKSGQRSSDGKQQGPWKYWYDTQRAHLKASGSYVDDRLDGPWIYWYENGNKEKEESSANERLQGTATYWYEDGQLCAQGFYEGGLETGNWAFWTSDGKKASEGRFSSGRQTDRWTYYYPSGVKRAEGLFVNGEKSGAWQYWDASGILVEVQGQAASNGDPAGVRNASLDSATRKPEIPLRAQPWSENDQKSLAFLVKYFDDGAKNQSPPAGGAYSTRLGGKSPAPARDELHSDMLVGKPLPHTELVTGDGERLDLVQYKGKKKVLLMILRGMNGEVCVYCCAQLRAMRDELPKMRELNTEVVVVYPGDKDRVKAFIEGYKQLTAEEGLPPCTIAYDPGLELVRALHIEGNLAAPTTLIIDESGIVRYAFVGVGKMDRPAAQDLVKKIQDMK